MSKKDNDPTTFPKKWANVLKNMPEFKDIADAASAEELKRIIITAEGNIYTIDKDREEDVQLNAAKELCKQFGTIHKENEKAQMAKIKYALFLLDEKGIDLGSK